MKKTIISILVFALSITLAFLLTACAVKECNHAYVKETTPPTCTENGFDKFSCTKCDYYYTIQINATGHTPLDGACTKCGKLFISGDLTYTLNPDGKSYTVTGIGSFTGTNPVIDQYNGLPVTSIGDEAFSYSILTSVTIGNGVTSIGDEAFAWCERLTSVTIPDSVTSIGSHAFRSCYGLTSITIPDSVTSIGDQAFYICSGLTSITVDASNPSYKSIDGNLYTKDGKTLIQYARGKSETSFTIPDGVTSIGNGAFYYCGRLTNITIPDSVTSIGVSAFFFCSHLTSITIPDSVTSIGTYAFYWCYGLTSIKYRGTEEQWNAVTKGDDWNKNTGGCPIIYNYTGE